MQLAQLRLAEEIGATSDTHVGLQLGELLAVKDSCSYRHDRHPVPPGGFDVGRGVAKNTYCCVGTRSSLCLRDPVPEYGFALFAVVAERPEIKEPAQPSGFQFGPANRLQIAGYDPEKLPTGAEALEQFRNRGTNLDT